MIASVVGLASTQQGSAEAALDSGPVRLILPPVVHAVPGIECNIYFDNVVLVLNPANYAFDAACTKGMQLAERWTFTATEQDVGDHNLEIVVRDEANRPIACARTIIRVVPREHNPEREMTVLLVGASLIEAAVGDTIYCWLKGTGGIRALKVAPARGVATIDWPKRCDTTVVSTG